MDTAHASQSTEQAEALLQYFINEKLPDSFTATLYKCYDLLRPDVVMEVAWRNGYMDYAMPFLIQAGRGLFDRVKILEELESGRGVREDENEKKEMSGGLGGALMIGYGQQMQQQPGQFYNQ